MREVTAKGRPLKFEYTGRQIKMRWATPVKRAQASEVTIRYRVADSVYIRTVPFVQSMR